MYHYIITHILQITSKGVYKPNSDITGTTGSVSHISELVSSDQGLVEVQTRSSQDEEVTSSITKLKGSNTISLNVIMITYL